MFDVGEYSSASECCFEDINARSRRKQSKNKRRFSDEQVRSLEVTFESETKLEPRRKAQLAKELGLRPRQVAIWFQNKRARWKSKQVEKDYGVLLDSYNNLASQFECLKEEKQSLLLQLQNLKNEMGKPESRNICRTQDTGRNSSSDGESDSKKKIENICSKQVMAMSPNDDDISIKTEFMALHNEENNEELLKLVVESPLTSSNDWGSSLDSDDHQWWDFWC